MGNIIFQLTANHPIIIHLKWDLNGLIRTSPVLFHNPHWPICQYNRLKGCIIKDSHNALHRVNWQCAVCCILTKDFSRPKGAWSFIPRVGRSRWARAHHERVEDRPVIDRVGRACRCGLRHVGHHFTRRGEEKGNVKGTETLQLY